MFASIINQYMIYKQHLTKTNSIEELKTVFDCKMEFVS